MRLVPIEPAMSAKIAGLRYVSDTIPGLRRLRSGRGFTYRDPDGTTVKDRETLRRIRSLVIPPAWTDVWICPVATGHIQASGRDARGRKQYRYHPRWRQVRDENKYGRMIAFGEALSSIRARVNQDLARAGLPREKVLATVVRLLETTLIRVGNEEYARTNKSYGLTTLRNRHVEISGSTLRFRFRGKSGKVHEVDISDRRLARIVKRCQDIPGYELFQYVADTGDVTAVDSADVNEYLREISEQEFTAKDFRTWAGSILAAQALRECGEFESEVEAKKRVVEAVKRVALRLGNTPAVCRAHYVHPSLIASYLDRSLIDTLDALGRRPASRIDGLSDDEVVLLEFLRKGIDRRSPAAAVSVAALEAPS
jgi:DNA topoisomerase-1